MATFVRCHSKLEGFIVKPHHNTLQKVRQKTNGWTSIMALLLSPQTRCCYTFSPFFRTRLMCDGAWALFPKWGAISGFHPLRSNCSLQSLFNFNEVWIIYPERGRLAKGHRHCVLRWKISVEFCIFRFGYVCGRYFSVWHGDIINVITVINFPDGHRSFQLNSLNWFQLSIVLLFKPKPKCDPV